MPPIQRPHGRAARQDAARNRERLVLAARTVFAEQGPQAPLEEIARRAEVSRTTLYRNFASREELAAVVYEEGMVAIEVRAAELAHDPVGIVRLVDYVLDLQISNRALAPVLSRADTARYSSYSDRTRLALQPLMNAATLALTPGAAVEVERTAVLRPGVELLDVLLSIRMAEANTVEPDLAVREAHYRRGKRVLLRGLFSDSALSALEP